MNDDRIAAVVRDVSGIDVPPGRTFFEVGLTSELVIAVHVALCAEMCMEFPISSFYEFPTPAALAEFLARPAERPAEQPARVRDRRELRAWIADGGTVRVRSHG
jgi:hypothetical protein